MNWEQAEEQVRNTVGGDGPGLFVRLEDGGTVKGIFRGDPQERHQVWTGSGYEDYDPAVHSESDRRRYMMVNFFDVDANDQRIAQFNGGDFLQLCKVRKKYGPNHVYEIGRSGTGKSTKYSILPDGEPSADLVKKLEQTPLHDLGDIVSKASTAGGKDLPF